MSPSYPEYVPSSRKRALVLSAGGGFGAYQAGAWRVLSKEFEPTLVIGASIGALNAWAIAGGMTPGALCDFWRSGEIGGKLTFRLTSPLKGFLDDAPLQRYTQELFRRYTPKIECGVVITELRRMKPRLVLSKNITWRHLYASCAIPFVFEQPRINGALYSDGGLVHPLPLWAARQQDAAETLAIDVWRIGLSRFRRNQPAHKGETVLVPSEPLGALKECLFWNRRHVDRWIALGESDALRLLESRSARRASPRTTRSSAK